MLLIHLEKSLVQGEREVAQSCPTLCNPMDYSLPGFSVHGIFQARVGCLFLLQRIVLTQGSNPGLPHWRQTLYPLSHQESPVQGGNTKKILKKEF